MMIEKPQLLSIASGSKTKLDLWGQLLKMTNAREMVEIGVWKGDFAKQILKQCDFIERYYMIDPWANLPDWNKPFNVAQEVFEDVYAEAIQKPAFATQKIVVLRGRTREVIDQIPDQSLDFSYIDGDHTLRGITIDLIKILPKMKEHGLVGGDDFTNSPWQHDVRFEPTLVCPFSIYFAEAMDLPIAALPFDQFLIQKDSNASFSFLDTTGEYADISLNKLPSNQPGKGLLKKMTRKLAGLGIFR